MSQQESLPTLGFYASYSRFKSYSAPKLSAKRSRRFDQEVWIPGEFQTDTSVLEIGCGGGTFLLYLAQKGVKDFAGMDHDPKLTECMPESLRPHFQVADVFDYLATLERSYQRVLMFDVLEHFSADDGTRLLSAIRERLAPGGKVIVRVPNASSPWGMQYQYGDLTHRTAYTPSSLRQLAIASSFHCQCRPQRTGSALRRALDGLFHALLSRVLVSPPEIWTANIYATLNPT